MQEIKVYDNQFSHCTALGSGDLKIYPKHFRWARNNREHKFAIVTESYFNRLDEVKEKKKIGLIIEPPSISQEPYNKVLDENFRKQFDFIFTHQKSLLDIPNSNFVRYPFMGCWINEIDRGLHKKSKWCSIVVSDKTQTEGHRLRHEAVKTLSSYNIDVFGRGYKPIENKIEALRDYMFHIVIENERSDFWYTEKLIDCFVTGTIPIYWGCPSIGKVFSKGGMMRFTDLLTLENQLQNADSQRYHLSEDFIKSNFHAAKAMSLPDDYVFNKLKMEGYIR